LTWPYRCSLFFSMMSGFPFTPIIGRLMRRITGLRSTTNRIYSDGPINYNTNHSVTIAYSIQWSNMLYRFVA
jgi:hypothetical protein